MFSGGNREVSSEPIATTGRWQTPRLSSPRWWAMAVRALVLDQKKDFEGTATDFLEILTTTADSKLTNDRYWPKNPTALGIQLRRVAPSLRLAGLEIDLAERTSDKKRKRLVKVVRKVSDTSDMSDGVQNEPVSGGHLADILDTSTGKVSDGNRLKINEVDTLDTSDTFLQSTAPAPAPEQQVERGSDKSCVPVPDNRADDERESGDLWVH
jgi:hypothetical protein